MADRTIRQRLEALEQAQKVTNANVDLVVNYCREIAKVHLTPERIAEIERTLPNGPG